FSVNNHSEMLRRSEIFKPHVAVEHTLYRADPGSHRGSESIFARPFQFLASWNYSLEHDRIDQYDENTFTRCSYLMCAFNLHKWLSADYAESERERSDRLTPKNDDNATVNRSLRSRSDS